jgi:hypothetical protein
MLLFFAIQIFREKEDRMDLLEGYQNSIGRSAKISTLVENLQTERRYSFGYTLRHDFRPEMIRTIVFSVMAHCSR